MGRGSAGRSSLKGRERAIVSQTNIGTVSNFVGGKRLRPDAVERVAYMDVSERIDTIKVLSQQKPGRLGNPAESVAQSRQEHALSRNEIRHHWAWSPNGWVT